jgi:hypothetical protein
MPTTAEGFFDAARDQFFGDDEEDVGTTDEQGTEGTNETEETDEASDELSPDALAPEGGEKPAEAPAAFKPYEFKGKVLGQEVAKKYETEKDLNRVIAQGEAAPALYQAYKEIQDWKASVTEDLQYAQDFLKMQTEDPAGLLNLLREELIPEEVMANWVYEAYQDYKKLAEMSKDEREKEMRVREAQRIIQGNKDLEADRAKLLQEKEEQTQKTEKAKFDQWRNKEVDSWTKKIPVEYRESVKIAMESVVARAKAKLDAGVKVTFREMSQWLEALLAPAVHAKSPSQMKREAGRALENKKNESTNALRGGISSAAANARQGPVQTGPVTAASVFDRFSDMVGQGKMKLRN